MEPPPHPSVSVVDDVVDDWWRFKLGLCPGVTPFLSWADRGKGVVEAISVGSMGVNRSFPVWVGELPLSKYIFCSAEPLLSET